MELLKRFGLRFVVGAAAVSICLSASTAEAAFVTETYVESRSGGQNFGDYLESPVGFPNTWASSSAKSTAPGVTPGIGSRFNSTAGFGAWFEVSPTLPTPGGIYEVYATVTGASGAIASTIDVAATGGTGLPSSTNAFSVDPDTQPGNQWNLIGTLTLDPGVSSPTIRFTETSHNNRFYADAILFGEVVPEPTSLALFGLAGAALLGRRRRA